MGVAGAGQTISKLGTFFTKYVPHISKKISSDTSCGMSVLHKKSSQSLRPSLGRIGWDFFSKIGIEVGTYFVKKAPNFEIVWPTPGTPRALTVKGVYEVSYSCYGQINGTVCNCPRGLWMTPTEDSKTVKNKMEVLRTSLDRRPPKRPPTESKLSSTATRSLTSLEEACLIIEKSERDFS